VSRDKLAFNDGQLRNRCFDNRRFDNGASTTVLRQLALGDRASQQLVRQ